MILDVKGLVFSYNSHPVLDEVRFSLGAGELLAILGPNGVGKTTLLKCINAIHRPRNGAILLDGSDLLRMTPGRIAKDVGYVAQRTEAARLTVFDAVLMGRTPHIRWKVADKDLRMVDAVLASLGLKALALRHIDRLSGGELQKVAVARALVQEPRLLLLDEPTSSLDLKNQMAIMGMVRRVVDEHGIAAAMTMHDLNTALRHADRFLLLKNGSIYAHGAPSDLTGDMVEEVYGLPVDVVKVGGRPFIIPHDHPHDHSHDHPHDHQ